MPRDLKLTPTTSRISRWGWPRGETSIDDAVEVLCGRAVARSPYVLGIDQAATSGWALADPLGGRILAAGTTRSTDDQVAALESLRRFPAFDWERVLVVFEDHTGINRAQQFDERGKPERPPVPTAVGLGDARGGWRVLLDLRAHPASQRLLAAPSEWQRVFKGLRMPGDGPKDACIRWASAMLGRPVTHADEADAMGLAVWGSVDGLHAFAENRLRKRAADRAAYAATRALHAATDATTPPDGAATRARPSSGGDDA